jgi:PPK2 family polyphosphate:nucleotide phosphotransferase
MPQFHRIDHEPYLIRPGEKVRLADFPTKSGQEFKEKTEAEQALEEDVSALVAAQQVLWASAEYAVLIILQGLDAAGKDGIVRHVMSGVNPQGCSVRSFKAPNEEELRHHFLWRPTLHLPGKGRIAIFNRSYYEEVLVVRVHPEFLKPQKLPKVKGDLWQMRFDDINHFEDALVRSGTLVLKFYLHISQDEQKQRFLKRLEDPEKYWKFNAGDIKERQHWGEYMQVYEDMLHHTSTQAAPWYVIPADKKWFARALVADITATRIAELDLRYPRPSPEEQRLLAEARRELEAE